MTRDQIIAELKKRGLSDQQIQAGIQRVKGGQQKPGFGSTVGSAVKGMFQKPMAYGKDLATNPETMANAMPAVMGTAGGAVFPFGGGTIGTAAGEGIRDAALGAMKKPIPGLGQHALELGTAAGGDLISGLVQKAMYGKQIGEAESKFGLGDVKKEAPPSNMRTAVKLAQNINETPYMTADRAKALKPAIDSAWGSGYLTKGQYKQYLPDFVKARNIIQDALNSQVPGRAEASEQLARVYTMPRTLGKPLKWLWNKAPALAARGARWGIIGVP